MRTFLSFIFIFFIPFATIFSQSSVNEYSINYFGPFNAVAVGENGVITITTDGGQNWTYQNSGVTSALYSNTILDINYSFSVGANGIVLKSSDGGKSWRVITSPVSQNLNDVTVVPFSQTIAACGDNGKIIISTDKGETWAEAISLTTNNLKHLQFINSSLGFAIGSNGTLLKTVNGGARWTIVDMGTITYQFNSIAVTDENNLTIVGDNGTILKSNNGGASWTRPPIPIYSQNFNAIIYFNSTDGILTGSEGLILKTTDGGNLWNAVVLSFNRNSSASGDLFAVTFTPVEAVNTQKNGIIVGENGVKYYTNDAGSTWTDFSQMNPTANVNNQKKSNLKLEQNYPNPFNPSTIISYDLPASSSVSLRVYDMLGREIKTLVNGYQSAGTYNVKFDGANLSSGIYFYVLKANSNSNQISKTMRMILTK